MLHLDADPRAVHEEDRAAEAEPGLALAGDEQGVVGLESLDHPAIAVLEAVKLDGVADREPEHVAPHGERAPDRLGTAFDRDRDLRGVERAQRPGGGEHAAAVVPARSLL